MLTYFKTFTYIFLSFVMLSQLNACQTLSKTKDKVGALLGDTDIPEIDKKGIVDLSRVNASQLEQFQQNMPKDQWIYSKDKKQDIYTLQNRSQNNFILSLRLKCQLANQQSGFTLYSPQNERILTAYDAKAGPFQFLLDDKNYGNPFNPYTNQPLNQFSKALNQAKVIKLYHAGTLYTFRNHHAELLSQPVSCHEHQ